MRFELKAAFVAVLLLAKPLAAQSRGRIVGVYDAATGDAVEGARVRDLATGTWALTTKTGTVSLAFVDTAGTLLDVRKIGFEPVMRAVTNAPGDTIPVMIVLRRVTELPTVVTRARTTFGPRGAADTVRKFELNGYYDRRLTSGAPLSAFVTDSTIKRLTSLEDLRYLTGRSLCTTNLYLDGARLADATNFFKLVMPDIVRAVEMYAHASEIPPLYNATTPRGMPIPCATLIWTK